MSEQAMFFIFMASPGVTILLIGCYLIYRQEKEMRQKNASKEQ